MPARARLLDDASAQHLASGDLEAVFLPRHGMLGASLRHRGAEILRRIGDLDDARARGSTAGIALLHPWANRLAALRYRAAGREVALDSKSSLLHLDASGLPIHGVPWSLLAWDVTAVRLATDGLTVETTLVAHRSGPVPVSFGFHPYFGLPGVARDDWRLTLPAMRKL